MGKQRIIYVCTSCGNRSMKWQGRCGQCGEWNTFVEKADEAPAKSPAAVPVSEAVPITEVSKAAQERVKTGIGEFDRVLGGGMVSGSAVLLGGDPGIGKSTLLLQVCAALSQADRRTLYVSCEESLQQLRLRADRLGITRSSLFVLAENSLDGITGRIEESRPIAAVVDSVQMTYSDALPSPAGSIGQVRFCAAELVRLAKKTGIPIFIVGHVTKEGAIAGPKLIEHIVDTVLYFEGERFQAFRLLRATKNRFGSVNEVGVFEMTDTGLVGVENPSRLFLSEEMRAAGSAVLACVEGTRAFLVEVQALLTKSTYGTPERKVSGVDRNRLSMLLAVLERRARKPVDAVDVFVNVVGGVKIQEPAADLPVCLAICSSLSDRALPEGTVAFGELGLGGEVRGVYHSEMRIQEARKLGFKRIVLPRANARSRVPDLHPVSHISEALALLG